MVTCQLIYIPATFLIKLSFVFTLLRFVVGRRGYHYALYALIASGIVISLFTWFWMLFFCHPISYLWRFLLGPEAAGEGSCKSVLSAKVAMLTQAAWALMTDLSLGLIIPTLLLWRLHIHTKVKASVLILLDVGSV